MNRFEVSSLTAAPNFIGGWIMEPTDLCDDLVKFFDILITANICGTYSLVCLGNVCLDRYQKSFELYFSIAALTVKSPELYPARASSQLPNFFFRLVKYSAAATVAL